MDMRQIQDYRHNSVIIARSARIYMRCIHSKKALKNHCEDSECPNHSERTVQAKIESAENRCLMNKFVNEPFGALRSTHPTT
jgi:hypothetical protein